ncbi:MAG TPA: hypothetical protein DGG94_06530 [Micromonosporaceae bacterium]|nr:hypothetical protein [Micromonosporaceae bacterium]HCU49445.1 hypothetical protein [Micromonosporaceae bacterium]
MRAIARLGTLPVAIAVLTAITALYYALVAFGNITDFGTNQAFVDHVLEMDTTFKDPDVMWRHISNNTIANIAYFGVILWESLIAIVLGVAFVHWLIRDYKIARRLSTLGWIMVLILFAGGFITIGGEWFQMWQSKTWNGLTPALQNVIIAGFGMILANLPFTSSGYRDTTPESHR